MVSFTALLYRPLYATLGVNVTFITVDGASLTVTALDKSSGVAVEGVGMEVQTIRPAAVVMSADVAAAGLTAEDIDSATLTMNGKTWRVEACQPRPSPMGKDDGELYCFLTESVE